MKIPSFQLFYSVSLLALVAPGWTQTGDVAEALKHPILDPIVPLAEVQAYTEKKVPVMPAVKALDEWEKLAQQMRQGMMDKVIFRDATSQQWRDAKGKIEWLQTIEGGPGYRIKKLRYEAVPGMWIPAIFYEPEKITGKIPVYLAVNGHDKVGKAAPYKQIRCINLAKRGIATLNVEWLYMGQLKSEDFAHAKMNQLDLCGVSGIAPFYQAMSRGIDILLSLPYADAKRVAVSGLSGGGWQTIFISGLDPRVTLCNPVAGYSSYRTRARYATDLGDSEQTPNDMATVADYAHLTAMLGGRSALLTFNAKDNCCFASDHAMQPLVDAAQPIFNLYGQPDRLRTHVNYDPGTHNYELDNRQAFYRFVGDQFFPGDAKYPREEIASDGEVKTPEQLDVPLPDDNHGFHQLAVGISKGLPAPGTHTREDLARIVKYTAQQALGERVGSDPRGDLQVTYWKLRIDKSWTVPVTELSRGQAKSTTIVVADAGRATAAADVEAALGRGERVLAMDPYYFGESKVAPRDYLYALMLATVGDRPLGLQASQVAAAARWARDQFHSPVQVRSIGPRSSTFALIAAALEPNAVGSVRTHDALPSLHEVIDRDWSVNEKPELFCFGLLAAFDIPQLKELVGATRVTQD